MPWTFASETSRALASVMSLELTSSAEAIRCNTCARCSDVRACSDRDAALAPSAACFGSAMFLAGWIAKMTAHCGLAMVHSTTVSNDLLLKIAFFR